MFDRVVTRFPMSQTCCHVRNQSRLAPYLLPWILIHSKVMRRNLTATDMNLSLCLHTEIWSCSWFLLTFELKKEEAKVWWPSCTPAYRGFKLPPHAFCLRSCFHFGFQTWQTFYCVCAIMWFQLLSLISYLLCLAFVFWEDASCYSCWNGSTFIAKDFWKRNNLNFPSKYVELQLPDKTCITNNWSSWTKTLLWFK